jgi:hypothetical protein
MTWKRILAAGNPSSRCKNIRVTLAHDDFERWRLSLMD